MSDEPETAVVISVPEANAQVLVRLPGHLDPSTIQVDFRPDRHGVWTPSDFFPNSVNIRQQGNPPMSEESIRALVGYERRLHKMRYQELVDEAHRVGVEPKLCAGSRLQLIRNILDTQGMDDEILRNPPPQSFGV
jgi:hypothetical protein